MSLPERQVWISQPRFLSRDNDFGVSNGFSGEIS